MTRALIGKLLSEPGFEEMTVTGELVRVHLDEHKLGIYHRPTRRVLDCYYDPELGNLIIDSLKGTVHVTGRVQLDAKGLPDKIVDVSDISAVDLRPLVLRSVETAEGRLVFRRPESVTPSFEDGEVVFELPELHIVATGSHERRLSRASSRTSSGCGRSMCSHRVRSCLRTRESYRSIFER